MPNAPMQRWSPPGLDAGAANDAAPGDPEAARGYEEGFARGHADGLRAARGEMQASLSVLSGIVASLRRPFAVLDEQLEEELCRLSIAVARQVVRRELNTDPDQIAGVIREVRKSLGSVVGRLRIAVHPDDAALVRRLFADAEDLSGVELEEDPTIGRGGCTVATDTSFVDATVETRIARIAVQLLGDERATHGSAPRVTADDE